MKLRSHLICAALLAVAAVPVQAQVCTPEQALIKAEETAITINRIAGGNAEKAARLHEQLKGLQERDPTRSDHGACEAYDRIIQELELREAESAS